MEVDLNLENYSFDELIAIFKLSRNFTTHDVKNAKKIVLRTHPDKSGLPKEYFLFFSKAYRIVVQINDFRNKATRDGIHQEDNTYSQILDDEDHDKVNIVENIGKKKEFNHFFNKMFEQMKNSNEEDETGYDEWLKQDDTQSTNAKCISSMHSNFEQLKTEKRALVVYSGIDDIVDNISTGSQSLSGNAPSTYTNTTVFSKHNYIDVKEAYDNPVIPVTINDYITKKKYSNVDEITRDREKTGTFSKDILDNQAKLYFSRKQKLDDDEGTNTAFKLIQQEEVSRKNDQIFWGNLKLLNDHK
jgi:hypothetical protein